MSLTIYPALLFTVALLVTTAYFLMGGLPLLVLNHDTSLDASFIRAFFNLYYKAAFVASSGTAISFALLGRASFAIGAIALAIVLVIIRSKLVPAMEHLGVQIQTTGALAIRRFRRVHLTALLVNLIQLIVLVWALLQFSP